MMNHEKADTILAGKACFMEGVQFAKNILLKRGLNGDDSSMEAWNLLNTICNPGNDTWKAIWDTKATEEAERITDLVIG